MKSSGFPDSSFKYVPNGSVTYDNNQSDQVAIFHPENSEASNNQSLPAGNNLSGGDPSDYSSDQNYVADFIATNAPDYGYLPLVELTFSYPDKSGPCWRNRLTK